MTTRTYTEDDRYEGDYGCAASEAEDDRCPKVATQVRREPWTPGAFKALTCDEHADTIYPLDVEATAQLRRDVEREAGEVMA